MFEVTVSGQFVAQHQLHLPTSGLEPLHDHAWQVKVTYAGPRLDDAGLLADFVALRQRLREVLAALDSQNLNQAPVLGGRNPSAEVVALYIAEQLSGPGDDTVRLRCVEVEEEPGCWARYFSPGASGNS